MGNAPLRGVYQFEQPARRSSPRRPRAARIDLDLVVQFFLQGTEGASLVLVEGRAAGACRSRNRSTWAASRSA